MIVRNVGKAYLENKPMPHDDAAQEDFVQQLGQQIHRYDLEVEHLQRLQGIIAVSAVKIERFTQALLAEVEQMKSHMAGITPMGFEPLPPQP